MLDAEDASLATRVEFVLTSDSSVQCRVFIGSSSEGKDVAIGLQLELEGLHTCEVDRWDQGLFEPSGYAIDSLVSAARRADFAVLIATPDDMTTKRSETKPTARDNVIFEFGLFTGILSRQRTFLLATDHLIDLPSDLLGLTRLSFRHRSDGNNQAEATAAAHQVQQQIAAHGVRARHQGIDARRGRSALDRELEMLCASAVAQGWSIKTNSDTTLRIRDRRGISHVLKKRMPAETRADLRTFAADLKADGLRVDGSIRRPIAQSPLQD